MSKRKIYLNLIVLSFLYLNPFLVFSQKVDNVPKAFKALSTEPETIFIKNELNVPTEGGHLQGVQVISKNGLEKLLISGSSFKQAYILQADLVSKRTDKLMVLHEDPFRHAGGFQVSGPYLAVGMEDNYLKTRAQVSLYNFVESNLYNSKPNFVIHRVGEPQKKTAGSVGILESNGEYIVVVSNWDSRNWDFYAFDIEMKESEILESFTVPDEWPNYQSINLIKDKKSMYAIGFYQKENEGFADLILVSKNENIELKMEQIATKIFHVTNNVDFQTAAGLQVDKKGKLHIWATQRDATKKIAVNRFSEK